VCHARYDACASWAERRELSCPSRAADLAFIRARRQSHAPFDVGFMGYSTPADHALVREYADAGATWWLEYLHGMRGSFDEMVARVQAGPPRI
jgi:hypothetical protein